MLPYRAIQTGVEVDTDGWRRLRDVPLFARLPDAGLIALWDRPVPRRYATGEVLRVQGAPADHLLVLLSGSTAASAATVNGRVVRFGTWSGPCALDKVALLDRAGHTATFTAVGECAVRAVPRARFMALLDDSAAVRLAAWLFDAAAGGGRVASLPGSQQGLADLLGVTRVTVNRTLSRLRRDGLVGTAADGRIELLAPELLALRATAERG